MFSLDTREVKTELHKQISSLLIALMKKLENSIMEDFSNSIERYSRLHMHINRKLYCAADIIEMDKVKYKMSSELEKIQKDYEDSLKILKFLFSVDHIFSESIISKCEETAKRHVKFRAEAEE